MKYMTLGLKFFRCSKMTITRRGSNLFPKFRKIQASLDEYYTTAVSNHDFKASGTLKKKEMHATLASQVTDFAREGDLACD